MVAMDKPVPWQRTALFYAGVAAAYLALDASLNLTNKWILSASTGYGFMFPLALTCCNIAFGFLALLPHMLSRAMRGTHRDTILVQWKGLVAIGLLMAAIVGFNNTSLVNMSLSLNQIIRAGVPVCAAIAGAVLDRRLPSAGEAGALALLAAGVCLAVYEGTAAGSPWAVFCCCAGTICAGVLLAASGRLLGRERPDPLRLAFYAAPVALAALLPLYLWGEAEQMAKFWAIHSRDVAVLLLVSSCLALGYTVAHSLMAQHPSAPATAAVGEARLIGVIILAYFVLGEKMVYTPYMAAGCAMAVAGFCLHSQCKLRASQTKAGREEGAVELDDVEARPLITSPVGRFPTARLAPGRRT